MFPTAFAQFVAPARARPQLWRLMLGLPVALGVYLGFVVLLLAALWLGLGTEDTARWIDRIITASTPTATLLLLLTFLGMGLGALAAARLMHARAPATLFGPMPRVLRDFVVAGAIAAVILGGGAALWFVRFDAAPGLDVALWLSFLPLALVGVLIQTGAEELLFRGYLQQQLAARFASPLAWLVLPSAVFGLVHFDPAGAGGNAWLIVGAAAIFGLAAADLTRATGSIGAAWGFHFVNNAIALLILATQGTLPGLALYLTPYDIDDTQLIRGLVLSDVLAMVLTWGAIRLALRR